MSGFYEPPPSAGSEFRERLFNPKWGIIEAALGRPVPGVLRELYAAPDVLMRSHFYCTSPDGTRRVWVDLFLPMDDEALRPYGQSLPPGGVAFADDEHGDPYFDAISKSWSDALRNAFHSLPDYTFAQKVE